ncbi:MAG: hypothetical protein ACKESC_01320 [Candidatus Hodgkinia cicadicola]
MRDIAIKTKTSTFSKYFYILEVLLFYKETPVKARVLNPNSLNLNKI